MKLLYGILFISVTSFFLLVISNRQNFSAKETGGQDSPLSRTEWEHSRYADPATGKIPSMGLWLAYQQLVAEGKAAPPPFYNSTLRNDQWQLVNDFFASIAVTKIAYDPAQTQTFYFCTGEGWYNADQSVGAGVFKSTDAGSSWNQLSSTANSSFSYCQDVDVHPLTSDVYVATLNAGLQRSKDGGQTWQNVLTPIGSLNKGICDVEFTKNGGIFATSGIFQSGAIYYSDSGDSGTWVKQGGGFPTTGIYRVELAPAPSNDNVAYAVACNNSNFQIKDIYKTVDKGITWTALNYVDTGSEKFANKQAWYDLILAVDPNNENVVAGGGWHLFKTKDGGNTWLRISHGNSDSVVGGGMDAYQYVHVDEHAIVFRNSDTVYIGCDGGVWKCGNFSADLPAIYERNYGYRVTQYYAGDMAADAGSAVIIGGTQDNGSNKMIFGGVSPQQHLTGYDGGFCAINPVNPDVLYTTKNSNGIFRFTNGGYGIADTITNPYLTDNDVQFINPIVLDKTDPEILYMVSNKGLWRLKNASTAKDSDWVQASKYISGLSAVAVSASQPHTVFLGRSSGGNIYRIERADTSTKTHGTIDCDPSNQLPSGGIGTSTYCSSIYVAPDDVNHVFVTYSNYGIKNVWESKNAASLSPTWQSHDGDLPNMPISWIFSHPTHPEVCYIGTEFGVFYTTQLDGDSTKWLQTNSGLAIVRVNMLTYRASDHTLLAATHGRGMFTGTVPLDGPDFSISWTERGPLDVGGRTRAIMIDPNDASGQTVWAGAVSGGLWKTTHIDGLPAVGIPPVNVTDYSLNVFPNPVTNGITNIQLALPESTMVSVYIFDVAGRLVNTIWKDQNVAGGIYHLKWQSGAGSPQGIYYVSVVTDRKRLARKVMVLK